jgi:hypothetical protein
MSCNTSPKNINYTKNVHGFGGDSSCNTKYLFELVIDGKNIGKKYFRNLEDNKYSHLIRVINQIRLEDVESYKVSVSVYPSDRNIYYNLEGRINQMESSSIGRCENIYIEFTKNDNGYALCSCFYTGYDHSKIFASPPN